MRSDDSGRERGPGLDFSLCFVCGSRPWGAAAFHLCLFILLLKCVKCSPVPASFFPYLSTSLHSRYTHTQITHRSVRFTHTHTHTHTHTQRSQTAQCGSHTHTHTHTRTLSNWTTGIHFTNHQRSHKHHSNHPQYSVWLPSEEILTYTVRYTLNVKLLGTTCTFTYSILHWCHMISLNLIYRVYPSWK